MNYCQSIVGNPNGHGYICSQLRDHLVHREITYPNFHLFKDQNGLQYGYDKEVSSPLNSGLSTVTLSLDELKALIKEQVLLALIEYHRDQ